MTIQQYGYLLIGLGIFVFVAFCYFSKSWRDDMYDCASFVAGICGFVRSDVYTKLAASYYEAAWQLAAERSRTAAAWQSRNYLLNRVQELESAMDDTKRMSKDNLDREWLRSLAGDLERAAEVFETRARRSGEVGEPQEVSYFNGKKLVAVETAARVRRYLDARVG